MKTGNQSRFYASLSASIVMILHRPTYSTVKVGNEAWKLRREVTYVLKQGKFLRRFRTHCGFECSWRGSYFLSLSFSSKKRTKFHFPKKRLLSPKIEMKQVIHIGPLQTLMVHHKRKNSVQCSELRSSQKSSNIGSVFRSLVHRNFLSERMQADAPPLLFTLRWS